MFCSNSTSFHEAIFNAKPVLSHHIQKSSWFGKKIFLGYSDASGWKIYELGLFDRILRKLNVAYEDTHRQVVIKKLDDLNDDEILLIPKYDLIKKMPGLSQKLEEICSKKIKNFGMAFKQNFQNPLEMKKGAQEFKTFPIGKVHAVETYKNDPEQCGKVKKQMIFKDIKHIESQGKAEKDITSVEDLMLYISGLREVDLNHPLCARIVVDVFKECNKETSEQLCEWLSKEKTFNPCLLKECLNVFIDKEEKQLPFSLYSIELLIKIYEKGKWNHIKASSGHLILPANHQLIVSSIRILIQNLPNEDRVIALAEWMMNQPEYDLQTFSTWVNIFKQKEKEKGAINLYYPLFDKMMAHFNHKWGSKHLSQLHPDIVNYLQSKNLTNKQNKQFKNI